MLSRLPQHSQRPPLALQSPTCVRFDVIFIQGVWSVLLEGCVPSRCVGVSARSWISLLCRGLPVGTVRTELKCRQTCSVSCSHAVSWMLLAPGIPVAGFRWIARARSKATESKGTAWCNPVQMLHLWMFFFSFVPHWVECVTLCSPLCYTMRQCFFLYISLKRRCFSSFRLDICNLQF